jgi:hypothetical protein
MATTNITANNVRIHCDACHFSARTIKLNVDAERLVAKKSPPKTAGFSFERWRLPDAEAERADAKADERPAVIIGISIAIRIWVPVPVIRPVITAPHIAIGSMPAAVIGADVGVFDGITSTVGPAVSGARRSRQSEHEK